MHEIAGLFRRLPLGVYVVGAADAERRDAFTAAWVTQVSFDPPLLVVSVNPQNASYSILRASGAFTINVLKQGQLELARRFGTRSGREEDKLADVRWHRGRSGSPILDEALAYFDCEVTEHRTAGDHELLLGRVVDGRIIDPNAVPLTYQETGDMDGSTNLYPVRF